MTGIDRGDCLVPYTRPDGQDAYLDVGTLRPGDLLDPASRWDNIIKPRARDHTIPINWLFFKGDMMIGPTPDHPFEGPWQKVYRVAFTLDLLSLNSSFTQNVMAPFDVNSFWESTDFVGNFDGEHKLNINGFSNWSCPIYEFGMATYYWTVPGDIDPIPTYQFRLTANDTTTPFYSKEFKLVAGRIEGTGNNQRGLGSGIVAAIIVSVLLLLSVPAGVYYWRQKRKHTSWWRSTTIGSEHAPDLDD